MAKPQHKPPDHLKPATAAWFSQVIEEYALEPHHVRILTLAAESWDRGQEAREAIDANGLTYLDKSGMPRARPEIAIERDSRIAFARLVRELNLDLEPPAETRPPRRTGKH
jgi:phage terminase small subunit